MPACPDFIQPLDFQCILLNTFAETGNIFIFMSYIFIAIIAAYFKMNGFILLALVFLYTMIIKTFVDVSGILLLMWIGIGIALYAILAKPYKN